jgi:hypothetical protein
LNEYVRFTSENVYVAFASDQAHRKKFASDQAHRKKKRTAFPLIVVLCDDDDDVERTILDLRIPTKADVSE